MSAQQDINVAIATALHTVNDVITTLHERVTLLEQQETALRTRISSLEQIQLAMLTGKAGSSAPVVPPDISS